MNVYQSVEKRQNQIIKIAHRKRRYLSSWQREQVRVWKRATKPLPEQQLFFMISIEDKLKLEGFL